MSVGVLTMHRVFNCGSVLQAYATQQAITHLGYSCELIDYLYTGTPPRSKFRQITNKIVNFILNYPKQRKDKKFIQFQQDYLTLSKETYYTATQIHANPPIYDVYCTGSDQVWNPRFVKGDTTFLLSFAPKNVPKISYAASFASREIPLEWQERYKQYLSEYIEINIREENNISLVQRLTGKLPKVTCDPTLLLSPAEWDKVAMAHPQIPNGPYLLVLVLGYMFDLYPEIYHRVNELKEKLHYPIVYLCYNRRDTLRWKGGVCIKDAGPQEFIYIIKNCSFLISDSFHGVSFATIYHRPVMGVVQTTSSSDDRISTLLRSVNSSKSIQVYNQPIRQTREELLSLSCDISALTSYIDSSKHIFEESLQNAHNQTIL